MNIYQIQQDLLSIFDELEENGGELTEELAEKLSITQEEFKDKVESYANVIKKLKDDLRVIDTEVNRLKGIKESKSKTIDRLEETIIKAINEFGDTKKSGVKYLDYVTGEVSVRKTKAVEVNENLLKEVGYQLSTQATYNKEINQLDVCDHIDINNLVTDYNKDNNTEVGNDDLSHINVDLSVTLPLKQLGTGEAYNVLREIVKYSDDYKLSTTVSKTELKNKLKENGSCMPNLAKLKENESLIIK